LKEEGDDAMTEMSEKARQEFLAKTRYGYLTTLRKDGSPVTVPVWFEWNGEAVSIFTGANSPKVSRIRNDPRVTLLVVNDITEYESWVAFDGSAAIRAEGGLALAERLAPEYWDLSDPERQRTLDKWRTSADFCLIELRPSRIRSSVD
jgi:PPOX class probable F420-dependent enzyme